MNTCYIFVHFWNLPSTHGHIRSWFIWLKQKNKPRVVLRRNERRCVPDYYRGRAPDLQLQWAAIPGAINVVNDVPSVLWMVRVHHSEKVPMMASDVIGEVRRYTKAPNAGRLVNLPAFDRLVCIHIL